MAQKVHVTPGGLTRMGAKAGILTAVLFLLFGLVFGFVSLSDVPDSEIGLKLLIGVFFCIWVVVCISMIVIYLRILSKPTDSGVNSLVDLDYAKTSESGETGSGDFETRLRKLELLKRDGLITDAEYLVKREQILREKW